MRKTILKDGTITNIVAVDEGSDWEPPEGYTMRDWQEGDEVPIAPEKPEHTELSRIQAKALAVFNGTDTFTAAQVQKILAGIVLRLTR